MITTDFHAHIGRSKDGGYVPLESLLRSMKDCRIRRTVIFPIDEPDPGVCYQRLNRKVAKMTRLYPKQLIGFMRIDPRTGPLALDEISRAFGEGLSGVKLHPRSENYGPDQAAFLFPLIAKLRLPVIIHTSHERNCKPQEWLPLFRRYPSIRVILAHGGKDHYASAAAIARRESQIFVETSTLSCFRTKKIVRMAGPRKVLFASDTPYSHPAVEIEKYRVSVSEGDRKLIFTANAEKFWGRDR